MESATNGRRCGDAQLAAALGPNESAGQVNPLEAHGSDRTEEGSGRGLARVVLRRGAGGTSSTRLNLEGYFDREPSDFATAWEPVPGLWMTAVLDPVNWSRRWTLFAARTGGGLEATRWEYLAGEAGEDLTVTGSVGVQHETMVNPAPDGPIKR